MNKEEQTVKEIFETLIKYVNLTPDAIDDLYYLQGYIEEKEKEIERLNNIINELEKESYLGRKENEDKGNDYQNGLAVAYNYIYNKIQKLKGSDK